MSSKLPTTMKAWQCLNYSRLRDPNELVCSDSVPVPKPRAHEVLVKVSFAAANPVDLKILGGVYRERFPVHGFPFVPGVDAAGEIAALGEECSPDFQVGDRVVLCLGLAESYSPDSAKCPAGTFAEYCACPEDQVCKVPPDMQLSSVAGLPLAGLSAYQALFTGKARSSKGEVLGDVVEGSKVLILGGDRGPGHIAVQLAHNAGATVYTTAAPSKMDFLRCLGADRAVDWRARDWTAQVRGQGCLGADRVVDWRARDWTAQLEGQDFDLVLDCVGWMASPEEMGKVVKVMKPGGQYIALPDFEAFEPEGVIKDRYFKSMVPKVDAEDLRALVQMLAEGEFRVSLDKVYLFEELPCALEQSARGQTNGKVVVSAEHHTGSRSRSGSQGGA